MAAIHDKAREERLIQRGGRRRHFRLSAKAMEALEGLAAIHDCTQRDVIEGLLLGTLGPKGLRATAARERLIERERLSPFEAAYLEQL